jgi:hypothetical protein
MADSFFAPRGDGGWLATSATEGPWSPRLQHGGPPAALLVRALQALPGPQPGRLARVTLEFLGPVPVGAVDVAAAVERDGRSVQLLSGELSAGGRAVLRARAWVLRTDDAGPTAGATGVAAIPGPDAGVAGTAEFDFGYGHAMQWRTVGGRADRPGPATVWARPRLPLVPDEQPSPEQVTALAADAGSGVSWELPWDSWSFVNVDLDLSFARRPIGGWVGMAARTTMAGDGTGQCRTVLHDGDGWFGQSVQSLLVAPRE